MSGSFSGPAQSAGVLGALISESTGPAIAALAQSSVCVGQASPVQAPRLALSPLAPLPPVTGSAAPMPGENDGSGGAGTFTNPEFTNASSNILGGGGVDVRA